MTACPAFAQNAPGLAGAALERARDAVDAGIRLEHGEGIGRDFQQAQALYCGAARAGSGDALVRLGWMYANGRGVPRDDAIAGTLFLRAAAWGHEMAGRLVQMIRAREERLPACLGGPGPAASASAGASRSAVEPGAAGAGGALAPTPRVDAPAVFRRPPDSPERRRIVDAVLRMAPQFRLDPRLVMAVMATESGFDPQARSARNAQGLMQLIPETAERFAVRDPFDPVENLRGGMAYLRWLLAYFRGDVTLALAAYNAGERTVERYRGVPPFAETMAYVQRIRAFYPLDRHPYDPRATAPSLVIASSGSAASSPWTRVSAQ